MFMNKNNMFPERPTGGGNLAEIIPAATQSALGALGGMGGGNPFMQGFNSAYNQNSNVSISPLLSNMMGQSNFAQLNTLGGLVSPISGGLY